MQAVFHGPPMSAAHGVVYLCVFANTHRRVIVVLVYKKAELYQTISCSRLYCRIYQSHLKKTDEGADIFWELISAIAARRFICMCPAAATAAARWLNEGL